MGTVTPTFSWPIPGLADPADGPDGFDDALRAIEATVKDITVTSYTPGWAAAGSIQPSGATNLAGRFSVRNGWCQFQIYSSFGASTVGGRGALTFSLPVPAASLTVEAIPTDIMARTNIPGRGNFLGYGQITTDRLSVQPYFPINESDNRLLSWQSADSTGALATGVPVNAGGGVTILNAGFCHVSGRYMAA